MNTAFEAVVTIATALVAVAIIALLVSGRSQTAGVITAAGNSFSNSLGVAVSPVTGGSSSSALPGFAPMPGLRLSY